MTKKLIWRLREQPTAQSLQGLVDKSILTKDEAREILFSTETEEDRDKKSLESEIKFLRELVEKLSKSRSEIIETIRVVEKPVYREYPYWKYYNAWCVNGIGDPPSSMGSYTLNSLTNCASGNLTASTLPDTARNFSDIKTF